MKRLIGFLAVSAALLLTACGGGGGCAGTTSNGTNTCAGATTTTGKPAVATFVFALDKTSITDTGADTALLTITALDATRNVIAGVPIQASVSSGVYAPLANATDASGQVKGNIGIGGDKSNRTIVVTFTDGNGATGTASVVVTGAQITINAVPATLSPSVSSRVDIKAADSLGVGIPNASIVLGGTLGFTQTLTTDAAGLANATITGPAAAGNYTVTAGGLGVTATRTVQVTGGAGVIPDAVGPISTVGLSINPNTIAPNAVGGTTNRATLQAVFQNASNQAIPNVRVRFEIVPPGLGSGEQISTGTNTVYTDASGIATGDYISGTRSSPTNGVQIRACYGLTDAAIAGTNCLTNVIKTMTVASQPINISLGYNNELAKTNDNLTYVQKFIVTVNDTAGVAISGAVVSASVDITHYGKGWAFDDPYYVSNGGTLNQPLTIPPVFGQPFITSTDFPVQGAAGTPPSPGKRVWCINEDLNRNGFLDTLEDVNGNGVLDPRKSYVTISYVSGNATRADGTIEVQAQYPMNVAHWLAFTVKVSTSVGGTEGTDQKSFRTASLIEDQANGSFRTPPFGTLNCISPF